jgi:hypothetical protein
MDPVSITGTLVGQGAETVEHLPYSKWFFLSSGNKPEMQEKMLEIRVYSHRGAFIVATE